MLNLIPQPNSFIFSKGEKHFVLNAETSITKMPYLSEFLDFIKRQFDVRLHKVDLDMPLPAENYISIALTEEILQEEGYRLSCRDGSIYIEARTDAGAFYALQTLKQILMQTEGDVCPLTIEDAPRYAYRGFMLDSGRYFFSVENIKKLIDLCALHKLNTFHWHLTEDQGFRVEIEKYPLLTQKGSKRSHTNFGWKSESGFYTKADIREIVAYCHKRFMKVIPEFDVPGHSVAAIACYPELSCFHRHLNVATHWGVKHDILCAGKESTFQFVFAVLDELMELFPDKIIHIGGDEAVKMRWKLCKDCQKRMQDEHLKNEDELQMYFMNRVNTYLEEHGFSSMMWNYDGIQNAKILDPAILWQVCSAKDEKGVLKAEKERGRKMICSASFPYYLDFPYGWVNLKQAYLFEPDALGDFLGLEAPLWTEYVPDLKKAESQMFPRLAAIAETAWSQKEDKSYDRFYEGLAEYFDLLNAYDVQYATLPKANPSFLRGKLQALWWNRRALHWQGLHNLFDDAYVRMKYKS